MASNAFQFRAALPVPPYTTRSCGRSATSGSRLFISIRSAASCCHPLHDRAEPRGARTGRLVGTAVSALIVAVMSVSGELSVRDRRGQSRDVATKSAVTFQRLHERSNDSVGSRHAAPRL